MSKTGKIIIAGMGQGGMGGPGGMGGGMPQNDEEIQAVLDQNASKFQQFTFTDEETGISFEYSLYVPEDYDASQSYPLIMFIPDSIIFSMPMFLILFVLLFFYIRHYFFLENTVQRWYRIAEEMREKRKNG